MQRVLIVDDEESIAWGLARLARDESCEAVTAATAEQAIEQAEQQDYDAVFLDVRLPGADGLSILRRLKQTAGRPRVVVITAFGDLQTAVRAYAEGAFDYLVKPFDLSTASAVLRRALTPARETDEPDTDDALFERDALLGRSPAMQQVFKRIAVVAPTSSAVLITGESGTGKELTALAIHRHSQRRAGPLVSIHLAALSATVVESELFGHCKGAYTGADAAKVGLLELADGGAVFLDEIGDVPHDIQVKLLRAIEQQEVVPVGSTQPRRTDFRLIAATNRNLPEEIEAGRFRQDLFFRLAAFEIALPALREREQDLDLLAEHFLQAAQSGERRVWLSEAARRRLQAYHWPGNVRQLRNVIASAALLAREGEIGPEHLALQGTNEAGGGHNGESGAALAAAVERWARERLKLPLRDDASLYDEFLATVEKPLLEVVLQSTAQNRAAAADLLGIHRATLRKKLS